MYYNNKKLIFSIFWICLGIALIVMSGADLIDTTIWSGTGGALCAVGVGQIVRNLKYRNDKAYREKVDIELSDERNRYMRMKAWSWAGYLTVLGLGTAIIVFLMAGNKENGLLLSEIMCFMLATYWISYIICKRKC